MILPSETLATDPIATPDDAAESGDAVVLAMTRNETAATRVHADDTRPIRGRLLQLSRSRRSAAPGRAVADEHSATLLRLNRRPESRTDRPARAAAEAPGTLLRLNRGSEPTLAPTRVDHADLDEATLLKQSREGDPEAFAELFRRHKEAAIRIASRTSRALDPQDVAAEAFARVWSALCKGGGPDRAFRAYLATAVRHVALNWCRDSRETATDPNQFTETALPADTTGTAIAEAELVEKAFGELPERWRDALWATEVEGVPVAEYAQHAGLSANAASALCMRAREGLKIAWLQAHIKRRSDNPECQWVLDHLGAHSRRRLPAVQRKRVDTHLSDCQRCEATRGRLAYIGSALKACTLFASTGGAFLAAKSAFGIAGGVAAGTGTALMVKPLGGGLYVWGYNLFAKASALFGRVDLGGSRPRVAVAGSAVAALLAAVVGGLVQPGATLSLAATIPLTGQTGTPSVVPSVTTTPETKAPKADVVKPELTPIVPKKVTKAVTTVKKKKKATSTKKKSSARSKASSCGPRRHHPGRHRGFWHR